MTSGASQTRGASLADCAVASAVIASIKRIGNRNSFINLKPFSRKGAKEDFKNAAALCAFAPLQEKSSAKFLRGDRVALDFFAVHLEPGAWTIRDSNESALIDHDRGFDDVVNIPARRCFDISLKRKRAMHREMQGLG